MDRHVRWLRRRIFASVATQTAETFALVAVIAFALLQWRTSEGPLSSLFAAVVIGQLVALARLGYAVRNNPLNYVFMRKYIERPFGYTVARFQDEEEAHPIAAQLPGFAPVATIRDLNADPEPVFDIFHDPSRLVAASISRASGAVTLISSLEDGRIMVTDAHAMPPHERLVMHVAPVDSLASIITTHQKAVSKRADVAPLASSAHQVVLDSLMLEYDSYLALGPLLSPFLDLRPGNGSLLRLSARIKNREIAELPVRLGPDLPARKMAGNTVVPAPVERPAVPLVTAPIIAPEIPTVEVAQPHIVSVEVADAQVIAPEIVHVAVAPAAHAVPVPATPASTNEVTFSEVPAAVLAPNPALESTVAAAPMPAAEPARVTMSLLEQLAASAPVAAAPVAPAPVAAAPVASAPLAEPAPAASSLLEQLAAPVEPEPAPAIIEEEHYGGSVFDLAAQHRPSVAPVTDTVAALVVAPRRGAEPVADTSPAEMFETAEIPGLETDDNEALVLRPRYDDAISTSNYRAPVTTEVPMVVVNPFRDPTAPSRRPTSDVEPADAAAIAEAELVAAASAATIPTTVEPAAPAAAPVAPSFGLPFDPAAAAERSFLEQFAATEPVVAAPTPAPAPTPTVVPLAAPMAPAPAFVPAPQIPAAMPAMAMPVAATADRAVPPTVQPPAAQPSAVQPSTVQPSSVESIESLSAQFADVAAPSPHLNDLPSAPVFAPVAQFATSAMPPRPATLAEAVVSAPDNAAALTLHEQAPVLANALASVDVHSPARPRLSALLRNDTPAPAPAPKKRSRRKSR